mmetsp:Transcript_3580/g.5123  ORF Transcript_3580/g.5123 Transcript_3580/m.5123 type:complete len:119 (-) Transcript_3580:390-746(-)|eukprot:CAMPEP_0184478824 /NCGR_PEP_ID=MMETSP0113_2-20130426/737_1 /TAXON_ID=91329 /ORGANISM="Norrisiella sphaerica, Strain BC52" /LENGTH=118 /DNA_ID=CAMNT_0026856733 /DNA_START=95 /DNA_END=454 /DNA_ORIENTATION=-
MSSEAKSDENFTPKYQLKEKRLIIDVRSKEEAEKTGELKASVRVECSMSFNPEGCVDRGVKNGAIPADPSQIEEVIVYCRSGRRAKRFADVLKKRGFKNIITGSIDELKEKIGVVSVN